MHGLRSNDAAALPQLTRDARASCAGAIHKSPAIAYFRGLTPGRVGLVLLICLALTVRQLSLCVFQLKCGIPNGQTLAGFAEFLGRQFLFALPMLFVVTVVDNMTARSGARTR